MAAVRLVPLVCVTPRMESVCVSGPLWDQDVTAVRFVSSLMLKSALHLIVRLLFHSFRQPFLLSRPRPLSVWLFVSTVLVSSCLCVFVSLRLLSSYIRVFVLSCLRAFVPFSFISKFFCLLFLLRSQFSFDLTWYLALVFNSYLPFSHRAAWLLGTQ